MQTFLRNVLIQLRFSSLESKTLDVYEPIDGTFVLAPGLGLLTGGGEKRARADGSSGV